MPETAYYLERAGSARALIYGDADYQQKTVVVSEADSIPQDDGPASSAIRALAADNVMEYDTLEKDAESGQYQVRRISKPGPTGLITTATKPLPHQLSTRLLTVSLRDDEPQVRGIMHAEAGSVNGARPTVDLAPFIAAQRWLELAGDRRVTIPFAHKLACLVPARQLRMTRDFRQLLTAVQAVALLYQRQRERDQHRRIAATLADYGAAQSLIMDAMTTAANGGITKAMRETAGKVHELYQDDPLTIKAIADALGLSKQGAWSRAQACLRQGLLINTEQRRGYPARLKPGDPLPEDNAPLPTAADVEAHSCSMCVSIAPENHVDRLTGAQPESVAPVNIGHIDRALTILPSGGVKRPVSSGQ